MDVRTNGGADFRKLAGAFKRAGKDGAMIRKQLTAVIQSELKIIVTEIRHEVESIDSKGFKSGGHARRESYHLAHRKRAARGGYGLRASIARAVTSRVQYTGRKIGARVHVDGSKLPQSQRNLPDRFNDIHGWYHPTFGHKNRSVKQVGGPYFDKPIERNVDRVKANVRQAVEMVMRGLK